MRKAVLLGLIAALTLTAFPMIMGNDYYIFNPIALTFKVGWGELGFDWSPQYQRMGFTLRHEEYKRTFGGSVWYIGRDLINKPSEGFVNLGVGGSVFFGESLVLAGSAKINPADLGRTDLNVALAFGGSTSRYFRFLRGLSRQGLAAIYYQPYYRRGVSFTNAYIGLYMDTWGNEGRISTDLKLDLAFTRESGTIFDFVRALFIFEKGMLLVGGGWNIDHMAEWLEGSTYGAVGLSLDAIKLWTELYYTKSADLTFAVRTTLVF